MPRFIPGYPAYQGCDARTPSLLTISSFAIHASTSLLCRTGSESLLFGR